MAIRTIENRWMNRPPEPEKFLKVERKASMRAIIKTTPKRPKELNDIIKLNIKVTPQELGTGAKKVTNRSKGKVFDILV